MGTTGRSVCRPYAEILTDDLYVDGWMIPQETIRDRQNKGVTLVELMIALVLGSLIVTGIYEVLSGQQETYAVQDRLNEQRQDLRAAISIMRVEMEKLGYNPACATGPDCTTNISSGFICVNPAGSCETPASTDIGASFEFKYRSGGATQFVRYWKDGSDIKRNTTSLVKNISSLTFTYYDKDGSAITPSTTAGWLLLCRIDIEITDAFTAFAGTDKQQIYSDKVTASVNVRNPLSNTRNPAHGTFDDTLVCAQ